MASRVLEPGVVEPHLRRGRKLLIVSPKPVEVLEEIHSPPPNLVNTISGRVPTIDGIG